MVTGTHRQPTSIKLKELFLSLQNQLQAKMVTNREFVGLRTGLARHV